MIDPVAVFIFFGFPMSLAVVGWVAVWLHGRQAPPDALAKEQDH